MRMRTGILLFCWLGLAACSAETPDGNEVMSDYDNDDQTHSAPAGGGQLLTATVTVYGETFEVSGDGHCRRVDIRYSELPEVVLEIMIKPSDLSGFVQISRGEVFGLLMVIHKAPFRTWGAWDTRLAPEEDPSEFDGSRFTFEGPVEGPKADDRRTTTMRVEIDCPFVHDPVM